MSVFSSHARPTATAKICLDHINALVSNRALVEVCKQKQLKISKETLFLHRSFLKLVKLDNIVSWPCFMNVSKPRKCIQKLEKYI